MLGVVPNRILDFIEIGVQVGIPVVIVAQTVLQHGKRIAMETGTVDSLCIAQPYSRLAIDDREGGGEGTVGILLLYIVKGIHLTINVFSVITVHINPGLTGITSLGHYVDGVEMSIIHANVEFIILCLAKVYIALARTQFTLVVP